MAFYPTERASKSSRLSGPVCWHRCKPQAVNKHWRPRCRGYRPLLCAPAPGAAKVICACALRSRPNRDSAGDNATIIRTATPPVTTKPTGGMCLGLRAVQCTKINNNQAKPDAYKSMKCSKKHHHGRTSPLTTSSAFRQTTSISIQSP